MASSWHFVLLIVLEKHSSNLGPWIYQFHAVPGTSRRYRSGPFQTRGPAPAESCKATVWDSGEAIWACTVSPRGCWSFCLPKRGARSCCAPIEGGDLCFKVCEQSMWGLENVHQATEPIYLVWGREWLEGPQHLESWSASTSTFLITLVWFQLAQRMYGLKDWLICNI